jgi:hypothetical protein
VTGVTNRWRSMVSVRGGNQRKQEKRHSGKEQEAANRYKDDEGDGLRGQQTEGFDQEPDDQESPGNLQTLFQRVGAWHQLPSFQNLASFW